MKVAIPSISDLLWPVLRATDELGGSAVRAELIKHVRDEMGFTDEQIAVAYSGPTGKSIILHRLEWTVYWLKAINPNRKIFEARKRETAALGAGEKLVLGHPLAATIGDSARCMQNLEKVLFTGPKTSDTVTFICD